jgi:hypothetical protein
MKKRRQSMPDGLPPFVHMSAGQSPKARLKLVEGLLFDMCKIIDERGYSFSKSSTAIQDFVVNDEEAPEILEEMMRHLLGVVWADDLLPEKKPFDLSRN